MIDGALFPDVGLALRMLFWPYPDPLDGPKQEKHLGRTVQAVERLPSDDYGSLKGPFPILLLYVTSGPEGWVDRVERVMAEVYSDDPLHDAKAFLEAIRASIVGSNVETPLVVVEGADGEMDETAFLDTVRCVEVPTDVPYQSDLITKATAMFDVTVRPYN